MRAVEVWSGGRVEESVSGRVPNLSITSDARI